MTTVLSAASPAAPGLAPLHDVRHQVHLLREALQSEKRRLGFFFGAGCPAGIYDADGKKSLGLIPDVAGLTAAVEASLAALTGPDADFRKAWDTLTTRCKSAAPAPNVEHVLTELRTIRSLRGGGPLDGMTAETLTKLDGRICRVIADTVTKKLPDHANAYRRFALWLGHINRVAPVEIFTPNYDLLLEEAFEQNRIAYFDGFVGSREPFFDLSAMEQDPIPDRWVRLWKVHGSVNWIKRRDESVYRRYPAPDPLPDYDRLLIYPSHLKYEQSRRMPYLAMLDRLRAFFRDANSSNSVLVVCGYSFADEHLNELLLEGLRGNRSAQCFALMYSDFNNCSVAVTLADKHPNLSVLTKNGAVIGRRQGAYVPVDPSIVGEGCGFDIADPTGGKADPIAQCQLGDFHHFTLFLEKQFGVDVVDQENTKTT